jgi:hypothetical protein
MSNLKFDDQFNINKIQNNMLDVEKKKYEEKIKQEQLNKEKQIKENKGKRKET